MEFICDDIKQEYYFKDAGKKISPIFDYEEDAIQWLNRNSNLRTNDDCTALPEEIGDPLTCQPKK